MNNTASRSARSRAATKAASSSSMKYTRLGSAVSESCRAWKVRRSVTLRCSIARPRLRAINPSNSFSSVEKTRSTCSWAEEKLSVANISIPSMMGVWMCGGVPAETPGVSPSTARISVASPPARAIIPMESPNKRRPVLRWSWKASLSDSYEVVLSRCSSLKRSANRASSGASRSLRSSNAALREIVIRYSSNLNTATKQWALGPERSLLWCWENFQ